jgi:hypothetical protein
MPITCVHPDHVATIPTGADPRLFAVLVDAFGYVEFHPGDPSTDPSYTVWVGGLGVEVQDARAYGAGIFPGVWCAAEGALVEGRRATVRTIPAAVRALIAGQK